MFIIWCIWSSLALVNREPYDCLFYHIFKFVLIRLILQIVCWRFCSAVFCRGSKITWHGYKIYYLQCWLPILYSNVLSLGSISACNLWRRKWLRLFFSWNQLGFPNKLLLIFMASHDCHVYLRAMLAEQVDDGMLPLTLLKLEIL